ncbi:MAG: response regulator [Desulfosudaceae bacterium]
MAVEDDNITVLLVDDEKKFLDSISERIRLKGFAALAASSGEEALEIARSQRVELAIVDQRMPGMDGLTTITKLREISPVMRTVLLTGFGTDKLKEAAEALDADYFEKDRMNDFWGFIRRISNNNEMIIIRPRQGRTVAVDGDGPEAGLQTVLPGHGQPAGEAPPPGGADLAMGPSSSFSRSLLMTRLIGESPPMLRLKAEIRKVAPLDCSVLIIGEEGSGRKLVAETIHRLSPRYDGPFLPVTCGAFDAGLLGEELFAEERPAASRGHYRPRKSIFETAAGGTILLAEINNAPASIQEGVRQRLEKGVAAGSDGRDLPLDVRVLAAADLSLAEKIAAGEFQQPLYELLNAFSIHIPPLRDRPADIPLLSHYFLDLYRKELDKNVKEISDEVVNLLADHSFPGNVRELENVIQHAVILCEGEQITVDHLPASLSRPASAGTSADKEELVTLAELEDQYIEKVVQATNGNKSEAARILGINRASLWRKLKKRGGAMDSARPIKLLIVDDDEKFLNTIAERLGLKDFDVTTAADGQQAIEAADQGSFDVAILDLNMPGMDGKELLKTLKENNPFLEAVMLTGYASIDSAVECTKLGAYGYLEKPYDFENLLNILKDAYQARLKKKFEKDSQRLSEIEALSVGSGSSLSILRSLRQLDREKK